MSEDNAIDIDKVEINKDLMIKYRVHYGRNIKTNFSSSFIHGIHPKGFYLIDVTKTLERLEATVKLLSRYEPENILMHSSRDFAFKGLEELGKLTGFKVKYGRFLPGTLTNYILEHNVDAQILFVIDHTFDSQAVDEALKMKLPIISFVDTNSDGEYVDLAIPANNKGKYSIAALLWSLAVLYLREKGILKSDEVINKSIEDFMVSPEHAPAI